MKNLTFIAAAFALSIAPAMAQEAPQISKRAAIYSADGTKIGRVEKITRGADGKPESVRIIYSGKFLTIPAASLSAEGNGLKSSKLGNASCRDRVCGTLRTRGSPD